MAKEKLIQKVRRCKNENCNEFYIPQHGDKGYCELCAEDWEPEPEKNIDHDIFVRVDE
jgi:hypothetical protein